MLKECKELPQYLLMENVPQVIGKDNIKLFGEWAYFLTKLGYDNYYKLLNAKDFGVPQNRNRCFMVSILKSENKDFVFPKPKKLKKRLRDVLEPCQDIEEQYYIKSEKAEKLLKSLAQRNRGQVCSKQGDLVGFPCKLMGMSSNRFNPSLSPLDIGLTLCARDYKGANNFGFNAVVENE